MPDRPHRGEGTTNPQRKGSRYVGQPALGVGSTCPLRPGSGAAANVVAPPAPPAPPPSGNLSPAAGWSPQNQTYSVPQGYNGGTYNLSFTFSWGQGSGVGGPYKVSIAGSSSTNYPSSGGLTYTNPVNTGQAKGSYFYYVDGQVRDAAGNLAEVTLEFTLTLT